MSDFLEILTVYYRMLDGILDLSFGNIPLRSFLLSYIGLKAVMLIFNNVISVSLRAGSDFTIKGVKGAKRWYDNLDFESKRKKERDKRYTDNVEYLLSHK